MTRNETSDRPVWDAKRYCVGGPYPCSRMAALLINLPPIEKAVYQTKYIPDAERDNPFTASGYSVQGQLPGRNQRPAEAGVGLPTGWQVRDEDKITLLRGRRSSGKLDACLDRRGGGNHRLFQDTMFGGIATGTV